MRKFAYITSISEEELSNNCVLSCINENNLPCILIKNSLEKTTTTSFSTDNLDVKFNSVLQFQDEDFYFHIITSKINDEYSINQFETIFDYVFDKITNPIDENDLYALIDSLQEYFRISPDLDSKKLQIGVFGELLAIKELYDNGYHEITNKYHKNFYLKHDIEISRDTRVEIKTTNGTNRIHRFGHDQIYREDIDVYVVSLLLEPSQEGVSLYDMFMIVMALYDNPDSKFALQKLMKKCGVSDDNQGLCFSLDKAISDMKFFDAKDLPKINVSAPDGVTNIEYDVDCSLANNIGIEMFISILKSLDE